MLDDCQRHQNNESRTEQNRGNEKIINFPKRKTKKETCVKVFAYENLGPNGGTQAEKETCRLKEKNKT